MNGKCCTVAHREESSRRKPLHLHDHGQEEEEEAALVKFFLLWILGLLEEALAVLRAIEKWR
jgi:hypothetical protein